MDSGSFSLFVNPSQAEALIGRINAHASAIRTSGAFVFDIDQTLLHPDEPLNRHPAVLNKLAGLLDRGTALAFISGGPGAVAKNRVVTPLFSAVRDKKKFERLSFYVNGGGSKFRVSETGEMIEDLEYARKNEIPWKHVLAVKRLLEIYLDHKLGLDEEFFGKIVKAWILKRAEQWKGLKVSFDDGWLRGEPWEIAFLEDSDMAGFKAAESSGATSFPFINTRRMRLGGEGAIEAVAGFTPTGFYALSKAKGDAFDFDPRDGIIEGLKSDLGEAAEALVFRKAGRSSIDITRGGTDKAACLKDLIRSRALECSHVCYFGDEFHAGGNDLPIAQDPELIREGLKIFAFNPHEAPSSAHAQWIGKSVEAVHIFLERIVL